MCATRQREIANESIYFGRGGYGEFDVDLFVIGGGSGGVRAARIAAGHGARSWWPKNTASAAPA